LKSYDYRSDTITKPTDKMRKAMYEAQVGDDVYGEDPTVKELEELSCKISGKEAAMFVPSGTMGNQIAVKVHTSPADEILLEENCHIHWYEGGGIGAISGVVSKLIKSKNGLMDIDQIERSIRADDIHFPHTSLICMENTNNKCGGTVIDLNSMKEIYSLAKKNGIKVHLDGARIFNAAAYLGVSPKMLMMESDSVMFCLSKGLCAPVGSILAGDEDFIKRARKTRKMLGGGMRQAGILAAAGIIALEEMTDRLAEDHENARMLAQGLDRINGLKVEMDTVQTNIVMCDVTRDDLDSYRLREELGKSGVYSTVITDKRLRFVLHYHISKSDVTETIDIVKKATFNL
jgi:threonine aldolase